VEDLVTSVLDPGQVGRSGVAGEERRLDIAVTQLGGNRKATDEMAGADRLGSINAEEDATRLDG